MLNLNKFEAAEITRNINWLTEGNPDLKIFVAVGTYISYLIDDPHDELKQTFRLTSSDFKRLRIAGLPQGHAKIERNYADLLSQQALSIYNGFSRVEFSNQNECLVYVSNSVAMRDIHYQSKPRPPALDKKDPHASLVKKLLSGEFNLPPPFLDQLCQGMIEVIKQNQPTRERILSCYIGPDTDPFQHVRLGLSDNLTTLAKMWEIKHNRANLF